MKYKEHKNLKYSMKSNEELQEMIDNSRLNKVKYKAKKELAKRDRANHNV